MCRGWSRFKTRTSCFPVPFCLPGFKSAEPGIPIPGEKTLRRFGASTLRQAQRPQAQRPQAQPADLAKKEFYEGKKDWEVWEDWEKIRPDLPKALIAFSPAPSLSHEDTKKKGVCVILIMDKERTEGVKSFIP